MAEKIQRYGTSCAEHPEGCFVKFSDYEALEEERADWKRRWQDAVDHASEAIAERNHWQSNHDHQVSRARFLIERGDIPVERVRAYEEMAILRQLEEAIRHDREMWPDTSDEFNPTGVLVTHALNRLDAARGAK
jgi:hypothetical protein